MSAKAACAADTTPPVGTITTPASSSYVGSLAASGTASDAESGINRVNYFIKHNSDGKWWDGQNQAWLTTSTPTTDARTTLPTTLGTGTAAGTWTRSATGLPAGANLVDGGVYTLVAVGYNGAGLRTAPAPSETVTVDRVAPSSVAVTSPANGAALKTLPTLQGSATDASSGIARVEAFIENSSNLYWTGSAWNADINTGRLATTVTGTSATSATWTSSVSLPSGSNLPDGIYRLFAAAYDHVGKGRYSANAVVTIDNTLPAVTLTTPTANSTIPTLPSIGGTVKDTGGMGTVVVILRRNSDSLWWNGTAWATATVPLTQTPLSTTINADGTWVNSTALPGGSNLSNGAYYMAARATDRAGNGAWSSSVSFNVNASVPVTLTGLTLSPTTVVGGNSVTGTVTLSGPAPTGGVTVSLSKTGDTNNVTTLPSPATAIVDAGQTSKTFTITTQAPSVTVTVTISAVYAGVTKQATLTVNPQPPFQITTINNGDVLSGVVTVGVSINDQSIPVTGLEVSLNSSYAGTLRPSDGDEIWAVPVRTECFPNGTNVVLKVTDPSGRSDMRTVNIQNAISNLRYDDTFDVDPSADDVPNVGGASATIGSGFNWSATIQDDSGNVIKTFTGTAPNLQVSWDGKNGASVMQPDGNYLLSITTVPVSSATTLSRVSPPMRRIRKDGFSTQITMTTPHTLGWVLSIIDEMGQTIRTIKGKGSSTNVLWDGTNDQGQTVPNGEYTAVLSPVKQQNATGGGMTAMSASSGSTTKVVLNKNRIVDSMILLDETFFLDHSPQTTPTEQAAAALSYAKFIRTRVSAKVGSTFDDQPSPLIVGLTHNGFTTGGSNPPGPAAPWVARIKKQFSSKPLKMVYVAAHGTVDRNTPTFIVGQYTWHSKADALVASDPTSHIDVSALVYRWNYGEFGDPDAVPFDPPKLVWMDNCESAGSKRDNYAVLDPTAPYDGEPDDGSPYEPGGQQSNFSWGDCFGVHYLGGYEGAFVGNSGFGFMHDENPNDGAYPWAAFRYALWNELFLNSQNIDSALRRALSQNPGTMSGSQNPYSRVRCTGTLSTFFN